MAEHVAAELGPTRMIAAISCKRAPTSLGMHRLGSTTAWGDVSSRQELDASERACDALRLELEEAHRTTEPH